MGQNRQLLVLCIAVTAAVSAAALTVMLAYRNSRGALRKQEEADFMRRPVSRELCSAAESGDLASVTRLLDSGVSPNAVDRDKNGDGHSALEIAAMFNRVEVIERLIKRGADVNACNVWGATALIDAAADCNIEAVRVLLRHGAATDVDEDGESLRTIVNRNGCSAAQALIVGGHS